MVILRLCVNKTRKKISLMCSVWIASAILIASTANFLKLSNVKSSYPVNCTLGYIKDFWCHRAPRNNSLNSRDSRISYVAEERFYKMITDKYSQVDDILKKHSDPADKLQLRLNFMQCTANHKLSEMLRRNSSENCHKLSVIADMKRRTPTHNPKCDNNVLSYIDSGEVALSMASVGFDVIFVNTDELYYGGHVKELHRCFLELRKLGRRKRPAIVMKDIILHPIQIAQAAEYRADGVLLNAAILGNALRDMLNACMTMGIEAIVEAHTVAEALRSIDMGVAHLLINQWDRVENVLKPTRALEIKEALPDRITAIACGGIVSMEQVHELALAGYDAICFGRRLAYPDVPEFISQVKGWKGPCKSILDISRHMFFDYKEIEDGKMEISLKENHMALLNEMNYFYFGEGSDIKIASSLEANNFNDTATAKDVKKDNSYGENCKTLTVSIGTPTTPDSMVEVGTILVSPEGQKEGVDPEKCFLEKRLELYERKWFIEEKKWIKENSHKYDSELDAKNAYELKKSVEMYNRFRSKAKAVLSLTMSPEEIQETERELLENVKKNYKKAPKIDGKVNLQF